MTIETTNSGTARLANVYPIIIGPKGKNHQPVLRRIFDNMKDMKRIEGHESMVEIYDGSKKADVKISAHLICIHQDQPERRSFAGLLQGGLGYHGRWGWSFNISKVSNKMPSCHQCLFDLIMLVNGEQQPLRFCTDCFNFWRFPQELTSDPEPDYPASELDDDPDLDGNTHKTISCKELSFSLLKTVTSLAQEKIVQGVWNKSTTKAYLS